MLDDLKVREIELHREKEKHQDVIQSEHSPSSDQELTEGRVAEINEELVSLQTQIEEKERAQGLDLLERIIDIFKRYGVTVTAVFLAAGVTIGALTGTPTNALKATGKALGTGLKEIGAKVGSLLPGLLGSFLKQPGKW